MSLSEKCNVINFKELGDVNGKMVVIEGMKNVPFEIKRLFYIYGTAPQIIRGRHANRNSEFILVNVSGTSKVKMTDTHESVIVNLDKPMKAVHIPKMVWKDMYDFSEDSVLLVIANTEFDPDEYIRDFDEYEKIMETQIDI